jgi:predicted DsbA family dithiol-disulfide isomerase
MGGKNISKTDNLIELAEALDLSGKEAQEVLKTREFREAVDQDWMRSRRMGVTAVPTFFCDNQSVVGAQPYEALANLASP